MNGNADDLKKILERTGFYGQDVRYWNVALEAHPMSYPFYISNVFSRFVDDIESDEVSIRDIIADFMKRFLAMHMDQSTKKGSRFEWIKIMSALRSELPPARDLYVRLMRKGSSNGKLEVDIPLCNATLCCKRFGRALGIMIKSNNQQQDLHQDGMFILSVMANEENSVVRNFYSKVSLAVLLPAESAGNNKVLIDMPRFLGEIKEHCRVIDWSFGDGDLSRLMEDYVHNADKHCAQKMIPVGKFQNDISFVVSLIHADEYCSKQPGQWRKGNVEMMNADGKAVFSTYGNLCLKFDILSGIYDDPYSADKLDPKLDVSDIQGKLRYAAAILYAQLKAMSMRQEAVKIVGFC